MKFKLLSRIFITLSILLSDIMCAVVAYNYCNLLWGGQYAGYSAPPGTALWLAIPYGMGIVVCIVLALFFHRKVKQSPPQSANADKGFV